MGFLNDNDLAGLHAKFVVPLAVCGMLRGREPLDDVAEYTMNEIIGEMQPDAALLCLALCTQHLAVHAGKLPVARILATQSSNLVEEYGPLWLANEAGLALDEAYVADMMQAVPEHLEELGDLLLALSGEIEEETLAIPAILSDILGQLAHLHGEIAEERLSTAAHRLRTPVLFDAGNIVPFRPRNQ